MSLLGGLFSSGTKGLNKSAGEAERRLAQARADAEAATRQGTSAINTGYDQAQGIYNGAASGLRSDLTSGFADADAALRAGYGGAESAVNAGAADANSRLDPFVQSGLGAQGLYDKAIGVGGADAAKDFYSNYAANDPYRAFRDEQAQREIERRYNATGGYTGGAEGGGSGRFATATARASLERGTQDLQTYMDRLERAGGRGGQYAAQQGQNSMTAGSQVGQLRAGAGTALAGNATNRGSALAGLGMNLADRGAGLSTGRAGALAGQFGQMAGIASGFGQQSAANEINLGNALRTARAAPGQNLLNLAGTAMQAYGTFKPPTAAVGKWQTSTARA